MIRIDRFFLARLLVPALLLSGCAAVQPPDVPDSLRPPSNQALSGEAFATGVQIYECTPSQDQPPRYDWVFKAPEAELFDRRGRKLGKHYAGPTWESVDGSTVAGEAKARYDSPEAMSIPWLLLSAKSTTGTGVFGRTVSILRLDTKGGTPPTTLCGEQNAHTLARVPYTATYYFYASAP